MRFLLLASIDVLVNKSPHVRTGLGKAFWIVLTDL